MLRRAIRFVEWHERTALAATLLSVANAVRQHANLPSDRVATNAVVQAIAAMQVSFPDTLDRLVAGHDAAEPYRALVVDAAGTPRRERLVDAALADISEVVSAHERASHRTAVRQFGRA